MRSRNLLAVAICLALAVPAGDGSWAQRTNGDDLVSMDFQNAELEDVIKLVAEYTGKNFLYDDRVRGQVTVLSGSMLTPHEAYTVFESILQVKGFTTVDGPAGVVKILPIREAKETALETVTGPGREPNRDLYITRLVALRYVKAETIVNTFRPLVSKDANIIAYAPTNTMIVTDTSANIRRLMTILAEIDVQTYQDKIKLIPIEYADAGQVTTHLQEIFSEGRSAGAAAGRRRTSRARTQRSGTAATAAAEGTGVIGVAGEPRFITDERTNSIIVIAPSSTITQIGKLVALLDFKRKGTGRIHVFRLQNADAEEMAETLSSLTQSSGGSRRGGSSAGGAGAAVAAAAAVAELEGNITITADAPTNSLIIQASAEGFAALRDVVEQLDTRRPQVLVEALIMEVDVDNNQSLGSGILFNSALSDETGFQIGTDTGGTGVGGVPELFGNPGSFMTKVLGNTVSFDLDGNGTIDAGETFPVIEGIITATAGNSDTNIIASPSLLTADNEEAQIIIGQNIPVPTSNLARDTGSDAGDFTTSQNIERQDVGVTLRVTPQISEGDSVRLEIFQEISEVVASATGTADLGPTTSNRQIENTVFVSNGESVMIGGILSETQSAIVTKVPFLGDIPILGWAFRSTTDTVRKVNLLVILTPHIVRNPEDLAMITVQRRERFHASAGDGMNLTDNERKARQEALDAGIELPTDSNPVRRELEDHREQYPTHEFPLLEERQGQRESARRKAIEDVGKRLGGNYIVHVSPHLLAGDATSLLESLIRAGYDGTVMSRQEGDQVLHTVQLGPFGSEGKALQVAREVRIESGRSTAVVVEP